MDLEPELDRLWQSTDWKTSWSRKTHRTEVALRLVRALLALTVVGVSVVLTIMWMQLSTGRASAIPVAPGLVVLLLVPAVSTLLIVANAKLQARRVLLENFRLTREASETHGRDTHSR